MVVMVMVVGEMSLSIRQCVIVTVGRQQHTHADLIGVERHLPVEARGQRLRLQLDVRRRSLLLQRLVLLTTRRGRVVELYRAAVRLGSRRRRRQRGVVLPTIRLLQLSRRALLHIRITFLIDGVYCFRHYTIYFHIVITRRVLRLFAATASRSCFRLLHLIHVAVVARLRTVLAMNVDF